MRLNPSPPAISNDALRTAGRRVGRAGLCHVVPVIWGGLLLWSPVLKVVGAGVRAWTSPTNGFITIILGLVVLAVLPTAIVLTTCAVSVLTMHRRLARTVAAGEAGAANAAFGLVAVELGCWLCAAVFALGGPGRTPQLPRSAAELLPLLMMAMSACALVSVSRARRATPPRIAAIKFAKFA